MSARDGLYEPVEPEWLREQAADELRFLKSLREDDTMTSAALVPHEGVNTETGEVVPLPVRYDAKAYLQSLNFQNQQQLSAAYDAACAALIGPNDVQQEAGRTFKKKSAWRKLARHFGISTRVIHRDRGMIGDDFVASITVRAVAPWGQYAEAEGACCTDEESGRRQISVSDCIATAETRATNRAISNLIAMGEVSADELATARPRARATASATGARGPEDKIMPFGKSKGKALGDLDSTTLADTLAWCREKDAAKFADLITALETVLENRRVADEAAGQQTEEGDLPF